MSSARSAISRPATSNWPYIPGTGSRYVTHHGLAVAAGDVGQALGVDSSASAMWKSMVDRPAWAVMIAVAARDPTLRSVPLIDGADPLRASPAGAIP